MISALKTIVLADTRWAGHHQTYLLELTAALLRCGVRIILMCAHPDLICERLLAAEIEVTEDRLRGVVFESSNRSVISKARDHDPFTTVQRWNRTGKLIREFEASSGWRADMVFLPYLDSYLRFLPVGMAPDILLGIPWSGLYFRNHHLANATSPLTLAAKGDYLLRSSTCLAVCVLDERFNDRIAAISGKPVIDFPDMTDETAPTEVVPEAAEIRKLAAGRKIIGLISMEKRKGILTLLKASLAAREAGKPWFFVATGPILKETFSAEELAFFDEMKSRVESGELDNLYFNTSGARIPDGAVYNSIFTSFDVVWAAYEEFEGSSNALTKASRFSIPILATAGQCIGGRVERYHMGATFAEGQVPACVEAIGEILETDHANDPAPDFASYHAKHSRARLDEILRELISKV